MSLFCWASFTILLLKRERIMLLDRSLGGGLWRTEIFIWKFIGEYPGITRCGMVKEARLDRERRWAPQTPQPIYGCSVARSVDSRVVKNWAKKSTFIFFSSTIWFRLPWEGMAHLLRRWELSFALLTFSTPRSWGSEKFSPRKERWGGTRDCFWSLYLVFLIMVTLTPQA